MRRNSSDSFVCPKIGGGAKPRRASVRVGRRRPEGERLGGSADAGSVAVLILLDALSCCGADAGTLEGISRDLGESVAGRLVIK
jgi:hypothetical protein